MVRPQYPPQRQLGVPMARGVGKPPRVSGPLGLGGATNPLVPRRRPLVTTGRTSASRAIGSAPSGGSCQRQESAAGLNPRDHQTEVTLPVRFTSNRQAEPGDWSAARSNKVGIMESYARQRPSD